MGNREYKVLVPGKNATKVDAQRKVVRNLGEEKARNEGAEKERIKMAKAMIKEGEPVDKISKYTGLSKEEIENL